MPLYDVNFTLACPACFVVEANSKKHAREVATQELENMENAKILMYLSSALEYNGTKITLIERVD